MKLISCYIEAFGAIKQKRIDFDAKLTAFHEENGYGKTTLAAFLEAMFYGMDSYRNNSTGLPTRKHYLPFDGGKYGGSLEFESDGDVYRIERQFDETSETRDKIKVYKNGKDANEQNLRVGEKFFGIDKASFERTIFIDAGEIEIASTGSINQKLGALVTGAAGTADTERALKSLKTDADKYKSRGDRGLIQQEKEKINKLNMEILNLRNVQGSLPAKYAQLAVYEAEMKDLQKKRDAALRTEAVLKDWEQYDGYINGAKESKKVIEELEEKYPRGVPEAGEIRAVREAVLKKQSLEKHAKNSLTEEETAELDALREKYENRAPSEQTIGDITKKAGEHASLGERLKAAENAEPTERESALQSKFQGSVPQKSALDAIDGALSEYRTAENEYSDTPDYIIEKAAGKGGSGGKKFAVLAVISAIIALAGIGVTFAALIAGIAVIAVGVIGLFAAAFLYLNGKTGAAAETVQSVNPEKTACERRKNNAENRVRQLLLPYGYASEDRVEVLVGSLKNDAAEYEKILQADAERSAHIAELRAKREKIESELDGFFALYGIEGGDYNEMLANLRGELGRFASLTRMLEDSREKNEKAAAEIETHDAVIREFCEKRGFDPEDVAQKLDEAESDISACKQARADYERNGAKAEQVKREKSLETRPASGGENDADELDGKINKLNSDIITLNKEISDCEERVERIDELAAEKQRSEETLEKYEKDYDIIQKTSDFIRQAEDKLKDKYIAPIRNNFIKYANMLEKALGEKVRMNQNFEITFECGGTTHGEKYLSAGQLCLCAFCFRIALIDNIYAAEKPFLILDDPFASLDENHLERAKNLLKDLSKDMQIIYFTCHESRAI